MAAVSRWKRGNSGLRRSRHLYSTLPARQAAPLSVAMVKALVPRYRYDQLMRLGWKIFLPTSLAAVAVMGAIVVYSNAA